MGLKIVIVGGGIGGLTSAAMLTKDGHKVTVLEAAKEFAEIGAGIHLPPNCSRILKRLGVDYTSLATNSYVTYLSWSGTQLGEVKESSDKDAPHLLMHRADLHNALLNLSEENGANMICDARVQNYDFESTSVTTYDGRVFSGDLIIAADGIKSLARSQILGYESNHQYIERLIYRSMIPGENFVNDPDLKGLAEPGSYGTTIWMGDAAYLVTYPVVTKTGKLLFAIALTVTCEDENYVIDRVMKEDLSELKGTVKTWDTRARKIVDLMETYMTWKLYRMDFLDRWSHKDGHVTLLGDAAHCVLPYVGQGAALAVEDAATLSVLLRDSSDAKKVPKMLDAYESIRMHRTRSLQQESHNIAKIIVVADGDEQKERDLKMKSKDSENPIAMSRQEYNEWLFGHDAEAACRKYLIENSCAL